MIAKYGDTGLLAPAAAPDRHPGDSLEVPPTEWRPHSWLLALVAGAVGGSLLLVVLTLVLPRGSFAEHRYHLWQWEAETIPSIPLRILGFGPDGSGESGELAIDNYFALTSALRASLDSESPDLDYIETLTDERAGFENAAERAIEERIATVLAEAGLERELPLFTGVSAVWPPVDFELTNPPQVLVRSPRDRIERAGDTLLETGLDLATVEAIEAEADGANIVSLVVPIGGIAAYPAIVREDRNYWSTVATASHEWVHHYLAFYPLGEAWGRDGDANALNETTANLAEREIARLVNERYPEEFGAGLDGSGPAGTAPDIDFNSEMRALRLEVDDLLAGGDVEGAERVMEERRLYFAEHGIHIRRINQAYFAFYGTYADSPASSDPIGPKVERVWELTGRLDLFLLVMRDVTTVAGLDAALAVLEGR